MLQDQATLSDPLSHRSGMAWGDNLVIGTENNVLISGQDSMKYLNDQKAMLPFRAQFSYNNHHYELVGHAIEALSGQSYFDFVKARVLDPLGLDRTFLRPASPNTENVAKCYNALDDATAVPVPCPKGAATGMAARPAA